MGLVESGKLPKPLTSLLNTSRKYSLWIFQWGLDHLPIATRRVDSHDLVDNARDVRDVPGGDIEARDRCRYAAGVQGQQHVLESGDELVVRTSRLGREEPDRTDDEVDDDVTDCLKILRHVDREDEFA